MIGQPLNRVDGPLKVSGRATYAFEHWSDDIGQPLYGSIVGATIGRGRITRINCSRAGQSPGVRFVMTHENAPPQGTPDPSVPSQYSRAQPALASPEIHHFGEPVALVIADTFEEAQAAGNLVSVEYAEEPGRFDFAANLDQTYAPKAVNAGLPTDVAVGDFDAAFASAMITIDEHYTTPCELAQPMEAHACMASWKGDDVTVWVSCQMVGEARKSIASTLRIDPSHVHLVCPFTGGGFGSKLGVHFETTLAILGAQAVQRPVKIALTRQQVFQLTGVRPSTDQRVRLGAERDGRLVALGHDVTMYTNPLLEFAEQTAATARSLYAAPNRLTRHRLTRLDLPRGEDVRAPGDAPGLLAVESAMDEMAHALNMDPVEFRILNEPALDPERTVPFSDRHLVECMREGADRFGWSGRPRVPASVRDGRFSIGYGMAAAIRMHFQGPTKARVRMNQDGTVLVRSDMTDLGTGTYTILTQVAAEALGVPVTRVRVELGSSDFPLSAGSGGSWGAGNSSVAVHNACVALRAQLKSKPEIPADGIEAEGKTVYMKKDPNYDAYSIYTYGAHFAEVGVDVASGEIRVRRVLGVFSPGRVLNAKTARSQLIGGITFGISAALHEDAVVDTRSGAFANRDFAEYLVPVNADIPEIDVVLRDEFDDKANVLGVKGLGELGTCGSGAAIANAVFNATGVRVRQFPITLEKLLPFLPPLEA
jgi:xanthine dehydrogenase YagR molybdenum-binding subunit